MKPKNINYPSQLLLLMLSLLLLSVQPGFAQQETFKISGQFIDEETGEALPSTYIFLKTPSDSIIEASIADIEGKFLFKDIPAGNYILEASFVGYETITRNIQGGIGEVNLSTLVMKQDSKLLEEVTVEGRFPSGEQKGDTTQFNARAYKTRPEADAEELIRKMPGVIVDGGKVQAQGEDVKQVLVDGKPFFGNDPNLALKNLPAEIIEKIEIFDQQSEQSRFSGFDDGETTKTINIVTSADKRNGQFGKIYVGGGTDNRYIAGGNLNFFNGDQRISVIGLSNNINQQNFSSEDILGMTGGSGGQRGGGGRGSGGRGRGGQQGGSNVNDFLVGQQNGIITTHAFGLNFSDNWGDKLEVSGSYFLNGSNNLSNQQLSREYFLSPDSSLFYNEMTNSESTSYNHRLNARIDYKIDENNSLLIRPNLSLQSSTAAGEQTGMNLQENGSLLSQLRNIATSEADGYNFSNQLLYRHSFNKRGRTFSASLNTGLNKNEGENSLLALDGGESDIPSDSLLQQSFRNSSGFSYSTNFSYTEPVSEKGSLEFSYGFGNNNSQSVQETFLLDEQQHSYNLLDTALSSSFENDYFNQRVGLGYRMNLNKLRLTARLSYQHSNLESQELFPEVQEIQQSYHNILPMLTANYKFNNNINLNVFYRTNTNQPSLSQLQDVVDYSNPLQISAGNPELDQQFSHSLAGRFSFIKPEDSKSLMAFIMAGVTDNYIGNATFIAQQDTLINGTIPLAQGGQYTMPVNLDGNWNIRSFIAYGTYLQALESNLNLHTGISYGKTPGKLNGIQNTSSTVNLSQGVVLSSNISEKLDFNLSTTSNFNIVSNSLQPRLNNNYFQQNTRLTLHWDFLENIFIENSLNHQYYNGLSAAVDPNVILWTISAGIRFLKDNRGELQLTAYDILGQNQNIQRNVTDVYVEDISTNALQQYYMLTFTYNLRDFGE